ncbi:MAG: amidohydrolase, partial [Clostridiales Family XIII bacterium]|nr:amidohydrolase [Clostridiales Family XIII bacterium]
MAVADLVLMNGKIVTVDKDFSFRKAVAVKDGWIIDTGYDADIRQYVGPKTEVIDLKGKMVLPGAHDAHTHCVQYGVSNPPISLDLRYPAVTCIKDMRELLAKAVREKPPGTWIKGVGWQPGYMEECRNDPNFLPRKKDLDDISPDHPVLFLDFSLHFLVVNSKALAICGVTKDTPNPSAGEIERDENGEPTGVFKEFEAQNFIMRHLPQLTEEERKTAIRYAQRKMNENGSTSYNESSLGPGGNHFFGGCLGEAPIYTYKAMQDAGELTCRVNVGLLMGEYGTSRYEDVARGLEAFKKPEITDSNWFDVTMLKIFGDGLPNAHTAWLWDDYENKAGWHGRACVPGVSDEEMAEELNKIVLLAHSNGYQVGIHAVGDQTIDRSLDAFIAAMNAYPGKTPRHYIIHGDCITNRWARKAARYDVGLSLQPAIGAFIYDVNAEFIGKRASRTYGLKELIGAGINVAGGSDCPCVPPVWLKALETAVTRKSDVTGEEHCPELAISLEQGIRIFTMGGAYQEQKERVRGSVEIGKVAD